MASVTGVVVRRRESVSKAGNNTYSLLVRDGDGNEEWYGFGINDPGVGEGAACTFEAERNGRWLNGDAKTVKLEKEAPTQEQSASARNVDSAVRSVNTKERSIMTQTAYKIAPMIVRDLIETGAVKFKATNTDAGKQSAMELYNGLLHSTAQELFNKFAEPLEVTADEEPAKDDDPYGDS